jgi:hypothetical protein
MRVALCTEPRLECFAMVETSRFVAWVGVGFDVRDLWLGVFHRKVVVASPGYGGAREFFIGGPLHLRVDVWLKSAH